MSRFTWSQVYPIPLRLRPLRRTDLAARTPAPSILTSPQAALAAAISSTSIPTAPRRITAPTVAPSTTALSTWEFPVNFPPVALFRYGDTPAASGDGSWSRSRAHGLGGKSEHQQFCVRTATGSVRLFSD